MIKKEFLLVLRDRHALLALFVMPAIFILIMSVAMRDQFASDTINFSIAIIDLESNINTQKLVNKIQSDDGFNLVRDEKTAQFIITIPKDYTTSDKQKIEILVIDSIKNDLLEIFKSKLLKSVISVKLEGISEKLRVISNEAADSINKVSISPNELFEVSYDKNEDIPNSTQQSVPAWIVFGMFFVIIPMSTIYINERKQNTLTRLTSMNISILSMSISKTIPYLVINQIQVWIMIGVGIFIVPFFNTPALEINGSILALVALSIALSVSAIGLSTLIAVSATSSEQATTIGGILNILLGAIGGVMVPKFIMPESMQNFANISPMSWGLDGFLEIFLKSGDIFMVANESLQLLLFGLITLAISMVILRIRISKGL
ncbi:MAG: ABC transporter permease [Sulfurimonas sp.]|nr:ABC transporter permease [Sulfurimonas sp.]